MVTDLTNGENSGMYKILSRKQLTVCGIPVALERKKIKTLRLSVTAPDGAVRVSAPVKISEEIIIDFISQKLPWIRKQQKRITENAGKVAVEAESQGFLKRLHTFWMFLQNTYSPGEATLLPAAEFKGLFCLLIL